MKRHVKSNYSTLLGNVVSPANVISSGHPWPCPKQYCACGFSWVKVLLCHHKVKMYKQILQPSIPIYNFMLLMSYIIMLLSDLIANYCISEVLLYKI